MSEAVFGNCDKDFKLGLCLIQYALLDNELIINNTPIIFYMLIYTVFHIAEGRA